MDKDVIASIVAESLAKKPLPPRDKTPVSVHETVTISVNTITYFQNPTPAGD
jgi:hypothetical protein